MFASLGHQSNYRITSHSHKQFRPPYVRSRNQSTTFGNDVNDNVLVDQGTEGAGTELGEFSVKNIALKARRARLRWPGYILRTYEGNRVK